MFILLRPEKPKEKERGFRCGFLVKGEPGPELKLIQPDTIPAYEIEGDERQMSLITFQGSHSYEPI